MESMVINTAFWSGKKVLITGHTGFKGSWLSLWLQQLHADVYGFALEPPTKPSLFVQADIAKEMTSIHGDIRDLDAVKKIFKQIQPDIVIHMAAQALVRYSYQNPVETYQINVMGTLHVLEAIRESKSVRAAVMVTTDKCYDNKEWIWPYSENEPMGGHDPYSSSKGCAELLVASYRQSFFADKSMASIATARAGNVIGGGDWSKDRLVPDVIHAFQNNQTVNIRNPHAVRPWQHVLEPLAGYLLLAEKLFTDGDGYAQAWNFGPKNDDMQSVKSIVETMSEYWDGAIWATDDEASEHEAHCLKLDSSKAIEQLGWQQQSNLPQAIQKTVEWHFAEQQGMDMLQYCQKQIQALGKEFEE